MCRSGDIPSECLWPRAPGLERDEFGGARDSQGAAHSVPVVQRSLVAGLAVVVLVVAGAGGAAFVAFRDSRPAGPPSTGTLHGHPHRPSPPTACQAPDHTS